MKKRNIKAVLFDMDGVLFDSMPYHATAWHEVMQAHGLDLSRKEAFMHEGRTGAGTINIVCRRQWNREATQEEIEQIYAEKSEAFRRFPEPDRMSGALELLEKVKRSGRVPMLVTGSGQRSLLDRMEQSFPGIFSPERMVTAYDVKRGKPDPEPYLMALEKGGFRADEALVVENAPLGVQAAVAAGVFTIAVNTGPLEDEVLMEAGADVLYPSMQTLCDGWEALIAKLSE